MSFFILLKNVCRVVFDRRKKTNVKKREKCA